jgi:hypothetical protein
LKKNPPIFMKPIWRSFLFCLFFTLKFHFLDLFFSSISCCDWSCELYNLKLTIHVILFLQMLCFMLVLAYLGAVGNEFMWDQWEGEKCRTDIRIGLWHTFIGRWRHFCSEKQWHWQWHRWHYWHKFHTVDWQYKLLTYWVATNRGPPTSIKTLLLSVFVLFFFEIIQLLEETNRYYHQYWDTLDEGQSPLPDMIVQDMCFWQLLCRWGTIRGTCWKITDRH